MSDILIALLIAVIAGAVNIIPLIERKVEILYIVQEFSQWIVIGLLIPFVDWTIEPWMKGLIIGELGMVPILITAYRNNKKAIPAALILAAILGVGIAVAGAEFIG